jgi:ADP-heptose:LPS heptosyltransferase
MRDHNKTLYALSRRLDPIWWLIARLFRLGRREAATAVPRSILLVDLHLLGDIVMLVPLLRVLRRHHPNAHIGLMAGPWSRTVLAGSGLVDEFIPLRAPWIAKGQGAAGIKAVAKAVRASRTLVWDWGIDVHGDVRNALLLVLARARRRVAYDFSGGASLLTDVVRDDGTLRHIIDHHATLAEHLGMSMTPEESIPALGKRPNAAPSERVMGRTAVHLGASRALRRMPLEEACALVRHCLDEADARLYLVDAPDTRAMNDSVVARLSVPDAARIDRWAGSLDEFMAFLRTVERFYAMDSGPAHLAAALGIDTTVFFGPNLARATRPRGTHVTLVERRDLPCRPCDQFHCTNVTHQECLSQVVRILRSEAVQSRSVAAAREAAVKFGAMKSGCT